MFEISAWVVHRCFELQLPVTSGPLSQQVNAYYLRSVMENSAQGVGVGGVSESQQVQMSQGWIDCQAISSFQTRRRVRNQGHASHDSNVRHSGPVDNDNNNDLGGQSRQQQNSQRDSDRRYNRQFFNMLAYDNADGDRILAQF
eukprot:TRINITY_DN9904_c0_g1_i6.p5 TRINITY_DN9904_c0_g1~~TRINITY_DN9904_c0_g1_i6.p5  ORF type:complete len:143 (-),score=4.59 TRINITY_DN9904_c0_g1_i6:2751-3179(-)